jgi:cell division protein ZapE
MSTHSENLASKSGLLLTQRYDALIDAGDIHDDPAQRQIMQKLQHLEDTIRQLPEDEDGLLSRLFKKTPEPVQGLYIWGHVGRGKSMLMDLFFDNVPIHSKRRVHFHAFMQEVHNRIHALRQDSQRSRSGADPVIMLAQQLASEHRLLCFDELQATDVADATLLYRLFDKLFSEGVIIVSTSNRPPENLYTGGVQAERFHKFIDLLNQHMQVMTLDSDSDYRLVQRKSLQQVYFSPLGRSAEQFIKATLKELAPDQRPQKDELRIKGRTLIFDSYPPDIAKFSFKELCEQPLGPADYLAIAGRFDSVILTDIPSLPPEKRNEAKRFVTLIDALYEQDVRLICTAAGPPESIYQGGDGSFEFQRTVSRLIEMQSARYLHTEKPVASA